MKTSIDDATLQAARLTLARALLDRLPEPPPPVVDGKTSGQICFESSERARAKNMGVRQIKWETLADEAKAEWQAAASAVLAAFGGQSSLDADKLRAEIAEAKAILQQVDLPDEPLTVQAKRMVDQHDWQVGIARGYEKQIQRANEFIRSRQASLEAAIARMEAVPVSRLIEAYCEGPGRGGMGEACCQVRTRLIAAARGEGQPSSVPSQPAEIPWIKWHGGECPLNDEEVEVFQFKTLDGNTSGDIAIPSDWNWCYRGHGGTIIAYRVLKWREGCGPDAVDWKAKYEEAESKADLLAKMGLKMQERAEKAEAELANAKEIITAMQHVKESGLSRLRPIAEAGPVPEGVVRVYADYNKNGDFWILDGNGPDKKTSHYADIYTPEASQPDNGQVETTPDMIVPQQAERADLYAELKAAHAAGKVIQIYTNKWEDWTHPVAPAFSASPDQYRIKPEPATFYAHGKTWTRHTPGDPMPCDGERYVFVLFKNGEGLKVYQPADDWKWGKYGPDDTIIGWRYADEPTPEPSIREVLDAIPVYLPTPPPWQPAVGDKVQLKGGSFTMTVEQADSEGIACEWHDSSGVPQARTYTPETLQPTRDAATSATTGKPGTAQ